MLYLRLFAIRYKLRHQPTTASRFSFRQKSQLRRQIPYGSALVSYPRLICSSLVSLLVSHSRLGLFLLFSLKARVAVTSPERFVENHYLSVGPHPLLDPVRPKWSVGNVISTIGWLLWYIVSRPHRFVRNTFRNLYHAFLILVSKPHGVRREPDTPASVVITASCFKTSWFVGNVD